MDQSIENKTNNLCPVSSNAKILGTSFDICWIKKLTLILVTGKRKTNACTIRKRKELGIAPNVMK